LAETLGVEAGDILLQVGDKSVRSTQDVREGLAAVKTGKRVTVKVNRRGTEKSLEAKKPESKSAEKGSKKLEKREGAGKGEIR
jgi:S1-C subfamily serine protease